MDKQVIVPPVLYLPVVELGDGAGQEFVVRKLTDGRQALLAYTALDRLARCCGQDQPWIMLPIEQLGRVQQAQPFEIVGFDLELPASQRQEGHIA
ncbi:MAG: SAV_915 family protein [Beutenbergiaceae bacterium]